MVQRLRFNARRAVGALGTNPADLARGAAAFFHARTWARASLPAMLLGVYLGIPLAPPSHDTAQSA